MNSSTQIHNLHTGISQGRGISPSLFLDFFVFVFVCLFLRFCLFRVFLFVSLLIVCNKRTYFVMYL